MRIKFEKGMTPERIAESFVNFIRGKNLAIGSVNMYIQVYDEEMKPVKFEDEEEMFVCTPSETAIKEYENDVIHIRRHMIKVVNG